MSAGLMAGKRGLIMGVANDRSIAWGIAQQCAEAGAELAFTYQGEALGKRVQPLAASLGSELVLPCDVTDDASIDAAFDKISETWGGLDFIVHAIGFSDSEFRDDHEHLGLFLHRCCATGGKADEQRRFLPDAHLLRRGKSHAPLQCDGRGQSGA